MPGAAVPAPSAAAPVRPSGSWRPQPVASRVVASRIVRRPVLIDALDAGSAGPVSLVAAPAGSGKTMLVRSWLDGRSGPPAAWVAVERAERDAQRFWTGVLGAICAAAPAGVTIEIPEPTPAFDGAALVRRLVAQLASLAHRLVLVIDDVHEVQADEVLADVRYLLEHLPPPVHVVLITRRDPHLGLHRRRVAGELTEIRSADLQFSAAEARQLLAGAGVTLSDEGLRRLHDRTEGWAAGLGLAGLSLTGHPDPEGFVAHFSGSERTVAQYLLAEVLGGQPARVRRLLMRTSLLQRFTGELGDLLTGGVGAEADLRQLADADGFIVAVNAERTAFRFHHLFADLLAMELRQVEPRELPRLHSLAAQWFADHGQPLDAIRHADAAGDRQLTAGLIIDHYFTLTLDGHQASAHQLLEQFVPGSAAGTAGAAVVIPEIVTVIAAQQLVDGSLDQAGAYLALAQRHADEVPPARRYRFEMTQLVTRLSLARRLGDFRSVAADMHLSVPGRDPASGRDIALQNDVRALALMNLGIVEVWSGRMDQGAQHLDEAAELAHRIGRRYLEVGCRAHRTYAVAWHSFTGARAAARLALAMADAHGWGGDPVIGPALVTIGSTLVHAGRLEEAERYLGMAARTLRLELEPALGFLLHMGRATLAEAWGRPAEAIEAYRDAEHLGVGHVVGSPLILQMQCSVLTNRLELGQLTEVQAALAAMTDAERHVGEVRDVSAGLALARGDDAAAIALVAPTLVGTAPVHHPMVLVRALLLSAIAAERLGEPTLATDMVERALGAAYGDSLMLPFLQLPCRLLLERHPRHGTAHAAFLAEILDLRSGQPPRERRPAELTDELSDAEMRVLGYLPTNLPAGDIADEIYLSVNTVKTHMRHIYAKLGAHSRVDAVARARRLGLLGHSGRRP